MTWGAFKMKTTAADKLFSLFVRWRANWTCQVCGWPADESDAAERYNLDCSHFFGRGNLSTRFDPDNAIAACKKCHTNLKGQTDPRYQAIMKRALGAARFDLLWLRGHQNGRRSDEILMRLVWSAELRQMGVDPKTGRRFPKPLSGPGVAA